MKRITCVILLVLAMTLCAFALLAIVAAWLVLDPESPLDQESAIDTTQEWARLADFPPSTRNVQIDTKGSMFSREFIIEFEASPEDIAQWLRDSPGPSAATPERLDDGSLRYPIDAGGGAQFAEVIHWPSVGKVRIRAYWS